jgi:hypothetical protein
METAPVALCILDPRPVLLGTGRSDSLQNVNTSELPDGACCVVLETQQLYMFVLAGDPGGIQPASGPGAWVSIASA